MSDRKAEVANKLFTAIQDLNSLMAEAENEGVLVFLTVLPGRFAKLQSTESFKQELRITNTLLLVDIDARAD
jgi:hypothetical protein